MTIDFDKLKDTYTSNSQGYYGYSVFGMKYPIYYFIVSQGKVYTCQALYSATYSDWTVTGQHEQSFSVPLPFIDLYNLNLDNGAGTKATNDTYFRVSQTLFNDDEDYEYIIPKLALVSKTSEGSSSNEYSYNPGTLPYELEETTRSIIVSDKSTVAIVGFKVVSSTGNILCDLDFDNDFSIGYSSGKCYALITIGGNKYLTFLSNDGTVFYNIDTKTSNINKVKEAAGSMFVQPTVVNSNTTINVSLGDDNAEGSDIVVTSVSGKQVKSVSIPATQSNAQFSVTAPSGIYCISRIQQGKASETKKIIVK